MPSVTQIKQEIYDILQKLLHTQGGFEIESTAARLALQIGFKEQTVLDIIEMMKKSKALIVDKYGYASPYGKSEVVVDDTKNND